MESITFGQKLKKELSSRMAKKMEFKRAELLGMFYACNELSHQKISFSTENEGVVAVVGNSVYPKGDSVKQDVS